MSRSGRSRGGFSFSEGDWTCSGCKNINFARRTECNRCGELKQAGVKRIKKGGVQIGKQAAEKSRGLFSADDWICTTCGNVNWARRSDCNLCNTPKIGVQEERTGLGGGFNERENVEYKRRDDSDDEYDQYGRKKRKKTNGAASKADAFKKESRAGKNRYYQDRDDGDDDDEDSSDEDLSKYNLEDDDDDDDDEDVSKYDLIGSDDDDDNEKDRSKSRSRSRSRSRSSSRSRSRRKRRYSDSSSSRSSSSSSSPYKRRRSRSRSRSWGARK